MLQYYYLQNLYLSCQIVFRFDTFCLSFYAAANGYTRSFKDENELHRDDLSGILNLLNVAELREIICILKQVSLYDTPVAIFSLLLYGIMLVLILFR